jgi:hypothetical protein
MPANIKRIIALAAVAVLSANAFAQQKPYFQQEVSYTIRVTLDDVKHELTGDEKIEYINNSPDELTFIYIHLWPNAYKHDNTALAKQQVENGELAFHYSKEEDRGFIDQLSFKVDGQLVKLEYDPQHIDIAKIILNSPLRPGGKIEITTPFRVKIPKGEYSRLGHIEQQYQITQWYPKPAVYDRSGWNPMPYLDQGEFYSEFGKFDVYITLPENYVVGATGDLVGGEKELAWLNQKAAETAEKVRQDSIRKAQPGVPQDPVFDARDNKFPASSASTKTLHYHQENVHDFAWFADKRYHVLKGEVTLPHSKRKVTTWVMFTNQYAHLWKNSIEYMNDAIYYYSLWNGDYPYNHATAVDGALSAGGGMEYPNVTVIGAVSNEFLLETVIMHEVGHNWFYGILGSNERLHPWMDEGLNSFNELRYIRTKYPELGLVAILGNSKKLEKRFHLERWKQKAQYELTYLFSAQKNEDQPIELHAAEYTNVNYGAIVYSKSAIAFDYLMAYLGEDKMDEAMRLYFETWKFRHPQPEDLRQIIEQVSGKNLSWLFDNMIKTTNRLDYKITDHKKVADGTYDIELKNAGQINGPVAVCGVKDGKTVSIQWYEGFEGSQTVKFPAGDYDNFKIDCMERMPEVNRNNNTMYTKGLFRKVEPLQLQFPFSLDNPDRTQMYWTPAAGYNYYNGFMIGVAAYNITIPQKRFEYAVVPMYSFGTGEAAGSAVFNYNILPRKGLLKQVSIGARGARYAFSSDPNNMHFNKISPELVMDIRKKRARSQVSQSIRLRSVNILKDDFTVAVPPGPGEAPEIQTEEQYMINNLTYKAINKKKLNPYDLALDVQQGDEMAKASVTFNHKFSYSRKDGFDIRLFAGAFIDKPDPDRFRDYRFRMGGWHGEHDYLYDHVFIGRNENEGLLSKQFVVNDGGFKVPMAIGQSSEWLAALNIKASLPVLPVKLFFDIGTCGDDGLLKDNLLYDAGFEVTIAEGIFEIYFPLAYSKDIESYLEANDMNKLMQRVKFTLNLHKLNPVDRLRSLSF